LARGFLCKEWKESILGGENYKKVYELREAGGLAQARLRGGWFGVVGALRLFVSFSSTEKKPPKKSSAQIIRCYPAEGRGRTPEELFR